MTSSEYRNTVYWTLQAHTPANETDLLNTARRIFNNLGVPFPQGTLADAIRILSSGDYMGWSICNADLAQQCANNGYPAIAVNENTLSLILPEEHTIAVNSPVAAVDHPIIWESGSSSSAQYFVFARLLDNNDVTLKNSDVVSQQNSGIMVAAATTTTCSSSCQVACQSCNACQTSCELNCQTGCQVSCQTTCQASCQTGCQVSCQSCNTCQSTCQTSCQTDCQVSCQSCDSCQSTCESVCQTGQTYTVSYNLNGGSGSVPESQTVSTGQNVTLAALQHPRDCFKLDHTFDGWNTNSSGTGTQYHQGETVLFSSDTILYAQFTHINAL